MTVKVSRTRRILNYIAYSFFLIGAMLVLFFAFGFRFNFQHRIFIHSGTITVKSLPEKVDMYLDGEKVEKQSYDLINDAYNINGIKPGTYNFKVTADGFSSWEKNIAVHSGVSTEFWNITLVPQNPEKVRLDIVDPVFYKLSNNGQQILYATRANGPLNIFVYSFDKETAFKIFEEPGNRQHTFKVDFVEFSPDQSQILFELTENNRNYFFWADLDRIEKEGVTSENLLYLNPLLEQGIEELVVVKNRQEALAASNNAAGSQPADTPLNFSDNQSLETVFSQSEENPPTPITEFKWLDNNNIYFLSEGQLYALDLKKNNLQFILDQINGYEVSQGNLYFVKNPTNLIFKSDSQGGNLEQITENLIDQDLEPEELQYKIFVYDADRIALINSKKQLYLFNDNDEEYQIFKKISDQAQSAQFSDDGKKLLYFNDNEIKVYYLREWEVQPRRSVGAHLTLYQNKDNKITDAMWSEHYQNVLFSVKNEVFLVELDTRDQINQTVVTQTTAPDPEFSFDTSENLVYFLDQSDKYIQLFYLEFPVE